MLPTRFITEEDKQWFEDAVMRTIETNIGKESAGKLHEEPYFVDFLREMPEPTGEEPEDYVFVVPKVYELVHNFFILFI